MRRLTLPQARFFKCSAKYAAFVGGFGSGKTMTLAHVAIATSMSYPKYRHLFVEPTYGLVRDIAFPTFEEILEEQKIPYDVNKSEPALRIRGCEKIMFRTMENPQRIVGFEVGDFFLDEWDTVPTEQALNVWRRCVSRARLRYPDGRWNRGRVATTPEGFRACYEMFHKNPTDHHIIVRAPTKSNPHLPPSYIEDIRAQYPPQLVEAYLEGQFVNMLFGSVYPSFDRVLNHTDETLRPTEPIAVGMDFNVGKMAAVVVVARGNLPHVVDELIGYRDTPDMIRALKEKFYGHHITVYPDASGGSRKSNNASTSDIQLLREAGFTVKVHRTNPAVRDRVVSVNGMFESSDGNRPLKVNTVKCPKLTEALESQAYDDKGEPDKSGDFDHPIDALGYYIVYEWPIRKPSARFHVALGA